MASSLEDLVAEGVVEVRHAHHARALEALLGEQLVEVLGKGARAGLLALEVPVEVGRAEQLVEQLLGQSLRHGVTSLVSQE